LNLDDRHHHVLVVEDCPELRASYQDLLESHGYRVEAVSNGAQALASVRKRAPCLVILDVSMPFMSGPDFLRATAAELPRLAVVMISAGFGCGTDIPRDPRIRAVFVKPVDAWRLIEAARACSSACSRCEPEALSSRPGRC
jgi:DNA-binding NtrC family response regulator